MACRRPRAAGGAVPLPLVLGSGGVLGLPLHVLRRVEPATDERADVVDDVALAVPPRTLVRSAGTRVHPPELLLGVAAAWRDVAGARRTGMCGECEGEKEGGHSGTLARRGRKHASLARPLAAASSAALHGQALPARLGASPAPVLPGLLGVQALPAANDAGAVDAATASGAGPCLERSNRRFAAPSPLGLRFTEGATTLAAAPSSLVRSTKPGMPAPEVTIERHLVLPASGALPEAGLGTRHGSGAEDAPLASPAAARLGLLQGAAALRAAPRHRTSLPGCPWVV